ncbi:LUD domain-containing protein [Thalassospiraceae bacterium LMO-JJ14]|nr:LUD domain-containing protein [Thalassospiraceae bacterium LMO-JJ14]
MGAREDILGKLKSKLGHSDAPDGDAAAAKRIQEHHLNLIPKRGDLDKAQRVDLFCQEATRVNATVVRVASMDEVPAGVSDYLREHQLPAKIKIAPHPALTSLAWQAKTSLMVDEGRGVGDDGVSVSMAFGGVAETGTLVMSSGPETPTSLNFLPLDHIVVLQADEIAGNYEAVWARIREKAGPGKLPRTVNWITGPSRTADIEQTLLLGAHGPQRLHILIIDPPVTPES